jgi:transcriptional regulator with XRE-family HTH domain/8-oxo-dGTP pyrophosphatase MutT (NUDIX family)
MHSKKKKEKVIPLGDKIAAARNSLNLTQEQLASLANVGKRTVEKAESSEAMWRETLKRILEPLHLRIEGTIQPTLSSLAGDTQTVQVQTNRQKTELSGEDPWLEQAESAQILALTFDSLYKNLSRGLAGRLHKLRTADLYVYSLAVLAKHHPLHQMNPPVLEAEWKKSVAGVVDHLLKLPELVRLTLTLISAEPTLTGSIVVYADDEVRREHLRCTLPVDRRHPNITPTFHVPDQDELFPHFKGVFDSLKNRGHPLTFVLRDKSSEYLCEDVAGLVFHLAHVSNHPAYDVPDREFIMTVRDGPPPQCVQESDHALAWYWFDPVEIDRQLAQYQRLPVDLPAPRVNIPRSEGEIYVRDIARPLPVARPHIVAFFALALVPRRSEEQGAESPDRPEVLLIRRVKSGRTGAEGQWPFDLPGGKCNETDQTAEDVLQRELLEELGLIIDLSRLSGEPLGWRYDYESAREGGRPVLAVYYLYKLSDAEWRYLDRVAGNDTKNVARAVEGVPEPGSGTIIRCPIEDLIEHSYGGTLEEWAHVPARAVKSLLSVVE